MFCRLHAQISRDFCRSNCASIVRLRSRHFQANKNRQNAQRGRRRRDVANERVQTPGGKTVRWEGRRLDKQQNNNNNKNNKSEGLTPKPRAGAAQSPRKREGGTEGRRKSSWTEVLGAVSSRSPVHGLPRGRRREHEQLSVREPNPPQPDGDHGEQRAHFPFSDVTAEHGGSQGHASAHRIHLNQYICLFDVVIDNGYFFFCK